MIFILALYINQSIKCICNQILIDKLYSLCFSCLIYNYMHMFTHLYHERRTGNCSIHIGDAVFSLHVFFTCNPFAPAPQPMNQLFCSSYIIFLFFLLVLSFLDGKYSSEWLDRNERMDKCEQKESNELFLCFFFFSVLMIHTCTLSIKKKLYI
jgi:hypothetical protein